MSEIATFVGWVLMIFGSLSLTGVIVWWAGRKMEMRGHRKVAEEARSKSAISRA